MTVRPRKNGIDPSTSKTATIKPHSTAATGFFATTRMTKMPLAEHSRFGD